MRIEEGVKREVLARTDIGELIGTYVSLKQRGNDLIGLCPFHGEKTPSFHVHPERGFFKCFGCDAGGDALTFVQRHENVGFTEALRMLAKRANVELEPENPATARVRSEKEAIYHANAVAAQWFHDCLVQRSDGEPGRAYCAARGISASTIDAFKLGFAPDRWNGLTDALRNQGVDSDIAIKAGLIKAGQREPYDFYRGRLMIPTYATTGEAIAFGGRLLEAGEPKYLNTATTPVYTKGRFLYALGAARRAAQREGAIIIVEGYLDCIALHAAGFTHAVAALGTAFTSDQARELRKATQRVFVCFDADVAGAAATEKSIDLLVAEGITPRIVALPAGQDPDSYVRAHGADGFRALLDSAPLWVQFKIERDVATLRDGITSTAEIARRAEALVRALPREEWDRWRVYVAGRLSINVDDLRKSRLVVVTPAGSAPVLRGGALGRHVATALVDKPSILRDIIAIALEEPGLINEFAARIPLERFGDDPYAHIYRRLCEVASSLVQPGDVFALFSDDGDVSATLASIAGGERSRTVRFIDSEKRREYLHGVIERFAGEDRRRRWRTIDAEMNALIDAGQPVPDALRHEHSALHSAKLKG